MITETNKKMTETYKTFITLIENTKQIITLDAFLSQNSIDVIRDIKNKPIKTEIIINTFQPYSRKATEYRDLDELLIQAKKQLTQKKNIVFITLSKSDGDKIYSELHAHNPELNIKFYYGSMSQSLKKFDNVEEEWSKLNVLIYTPIITCGVNFDPPTPHFHSLYIWAIPNSCVVRDVFQSSLRVRKLIDDECFFAISRSKYNYFARKYNVDTIGVVNIKQNIYQNQQIIQDLNLDNEHVPEWAIQNLAFKINEQVVSNNYLVEFMYEYFRICGYSIIPYRDKATFLKQEGCAGGGVPAYGNIDYLSIEEYQHLQRTPNDTTEEQKYEILKFEFLNTFHEFDKFYHENDKSKTQCEMIWNSIFSIPNVMDNIHYELTADKLNRKDKDKIDSTVFDVFVNYQGKKFELIKQIKSIMNLEYTWDIQFDTYSIEDKVEPLMNIIKDYRSIYNIRKQQGTNTSKYVIASIKNIIKDWLGNDLSIQRVKKDKQQYYTYQFDKGAYQTKIFKKIVKYHK